MLGVTECASIASGPSNAELLALNALVISIGCSCFGVWSGRILVHREFITESPNRKELLVHLINCFLRPNLWRRCVEYSSPITEVGAPMSTQSRIGRRGSWRSLLTLRENGVKWTSQIDCHLISRPEYSGYFSRRPFENAFCIIRAGIGVRWIFVVWFLPNAWNNRLV